MFRYFFALCLLAVVAISVNAEVGQTEHGNSIAEPASIQGKVVAKIISKIAAGITASCVLEAAEHCKSFWKNPSGAISCAKKFFEANKGRCAVGK